MSWPEIPTPGGDLAVVEEAANVLAARTRLVRADAVELRRIATEVSAAWLSSSGDTFTVRVGRACDVIDEVATAHEQTVKRLYAYCDEWTTAESSSKRAKSSIDDALSTYRSDGKNRAADLATAIREGIEGLDDGVDDIPVVGGLLSKGTEVITDGAAQVAESLVNRLLDWDPQLPEPVLLPVLGDQVDTVEHLLSAVGDAAEWTIDRLLDGIGAVVDLIGGAIDAAVSALRAVGTALTDAVETALKVARDGVETLLELGQTVAREVAELVETVGNIVFEAMVDIYGGLVQAIQAIGGAFADIVAFLEDLGVTLGSAVILWLRANMPFWDADRRVRNGDELDRAAFRAWIDNRVVYRRADGTPVTYQEDLIARGKLANAAYDEAEDKAPDGWTRIERRPGEDGFSASVYRNDDTGEIVISYRGTNPTEVDDIREDAANAAGLSSTSQGRQAVALAEEIAADPRYRGRTISYTGHSLGGSLASTASIATGNPATTYNAAGVGDGNYDHAVEHGGKGVSEEQILNIHTGTDPLTLGQEALDVRPASGAQLTVGTTSVPGSHSVKNFDYDEVAPP